MIPVMVFVANDMEKVICSSSWSYTKRRIVKNARTGESTKLRMRGTDQVAVLIACK